MADVTIRRMPYGFGPVPGPRQRLGGGRHDWTRSYRDVASFRFRTRPEDLAALLPPGFRLAGQPVVTVEWQQLRNLPWLAGRGYNTIGVRFPAAYRGQGEEIAGSFLAVLWENMADPIISGREELGFAKAYCEIPDQDPEQPRQQYAGSWSGCTFMRLALEDIQSMPEERFAEPDDGIKSQGLLHYKYIPATGEWGQADCEYAVLSPAASPAKPLSCKSARGTLQIIKGSFEQLPTLCHIVDGLAALEQLSFEGATLARYSGNSDRYNQRQIR